MEFCTKRLQGSHLRTRADCLGRHDYDRPFFIPRIIFPVGFFSPRMIFEPREPLFSLQRFMVSSSLSFSSSNGPSRPSANWQGW
jgi:hypothetical protein